MVVGGVGALVVGAPVGDREGDCVGASVGARHSTALIDALRANPVNELPIVYEFPMHAAKAGSVALTLSEALTSCTPTAALP